MGMTVNCGITWQNVHKWVESIVSRTLNYVEEKVVTGHIDPMSIYSTVTHSFVHMILEEYLIVKDTILLYLFNI